MTTLHTPWRRLFTQLETFSVDPTGDCDLNFVIRTQTGLDLIGQVYGCDDIAKANARRLVACWNACLDVPTGVLENLADDGATIAPIYRDLLVQRDELLSALKEMVSIVDIHSRATKNNFAWAEMDEARATIAKAEGKA